MKKHNFALTGVAGYIAPRHLEAIRAVGGELSAALDPHDSVGILDRYFPQCRFFTEFERFDRHLEKLRRQDPSQKIDYLSVCSPNYLHDSHIRTALRVGAHAICEKPLVLNPWNLDALEELESETGKKVFTILQLRLLPSLLQLKKEIETTRSKTQKKRIVELSYITSRGQWYLNSWKGKNEYSGGLSTNIGIHFFDLLMWFFGSPKKSEVHLHTPTRMAGYLELDHADIHWFLSVESEDLRLTPQKEGKPTYRSITIDGQELEFSEGFTDLHTMSYQNILSEQGVGIKEARPSVELVHQIRTSKIIQTPGSTHPYLQKNRDLG